MSRQCGIFPSGCNNSLPLVGARCQYIVIDIHTVASLVQSYVSNANEAQSVVYVFLLPPDAAVCAFKAVIDGDRIVKGVVQEKVQARRNYDRAVREGKPAGLLDKEHEDGTPMRLSLPFICSQLSSVFQINLGSILPKQRIDIQCVDTFQLD